MTMDKANQARNGGEPLECRRLIFCREWTGHVVCEPLIYSAPTAAADNPYSSVAGCCPRLVYLSDLPADHIYGDWAMSKNKKPKSLFSFRQENASGDNIIDFKKVELVSEEALYLNDLKLSDIEPVDKILLKLMFNCWIVETKLALFSNGVTHKQYDHIDAVFGTEEYLLDGIKASGFELPSEMSTLYVAFLKPSKLVVIFASDKWFESRKALLTNNLSMDSGICTMRHLMWAIAHAGRDYEI